MGPFTMRAVGQTVLGKGREGTEGIYTGDVSFGGIYHVGEGHGPFLRLGMRGYMMGNEAVWLSSFEIPTGEVGYQYLKGPWLFEAAGRAGLVLTGRHRLYGTLPSGIDYFEQRKLETSPEWGGHLALGYKSLRVEGEFTRILIHDGIGTPLDVWAGSACFRPGRFGACADARLWTAEVARIDGSVQVLAVAYGGLSVGIWTP
jgi:hypothetical protein